MKRKTLLFLLLTLSFGAAAQEYRWKVGLDYFFDNTEYEKSSFIDSETMNGVWLNPLGSIVWDEKHSVNAGVNLLKIPGMHRAIDKVDVTMYYEYKTPKVLFRVGAFPRADILSNYNNFFFKDSVNNFIPLLQGVFWQLGDDGNFFNAWMDWTGYATPTSREHFFLGLSGKLSRGLFFADFQSYMYHYSVSKPALPDENVSENLQLQASLGMQYERGGFKGLLAAGALLGYERDRRFDDRLYRPVGFTARADAEYCGIGTRNTLYAGDERMRLADTFGGSLYWGTQFLRSKFYTESEWYIRLIESDRVKVRFNCNLHFTEGETLFQQMLTVSASIDNFGFLNGKSIVFPWMKIFNL